MFGQMAIELAGREHDIAVQKDAIAKQKADLHMSQLLLEEAKGMRSYVSVKRACVAISFNSIPGLFISYFAEKKKKPSKKKTPPAPQK